MSPHFFWQHISCQRSEQISNGHPCNMSAIWNCLDTEVALSLVGSPEEAARIRGSEATVLGNVAVEMVRTIKMGTWGSWLSQKHEVRHRVTPWTVGHCADAFIQLQVGQDVRTTFERFQGKTFSWRHVAHAFPVMLRESGTGQGGVLAERCFKDGSERVFHTAEHSVLK